MNTDRFLFRAWHHGGGDPRVKGRMNYSHPFPVLFWEQVEDEVLSVELMQCTGIKDKNGKLIFEGDLLRHMQEDESYEVTCDRGMYLIDDSPLYYQSPNEFLEIVGNIHENPELLREVE